LQNNQHSDSEVSSQHYDFNSLRQNLDHHVQNN